MSRALIITYFALLVTAATGAFVFFGFALFGPPKPRKRGATVSMPRRTLPLNWVVLHIFFACVTLILFTFAVFDPAALAF
ncbi:hypothetical protein [Sulfobacillus harzensis]|uniref:Uncharacterized protein n=1 Tax=Sulfobacillus harzensis TaxID=2729629 RepID=A0A7Y0Q0X1_9FIRM|nr:hypothetical protein [Sulfobacillus harzensis]NMP20852.1 hypothetical protein [Sulfobacillus harzensis]